MKTQNAQTFQAKSKKPSHIPSRSEYRPNRRVRKPPFSLFEGMEGFSLKPFLVQLIRLRYEVHRLGWVLKNH